MEGQTIMRELPTSGRPFVPPPRPAPEATYDLAWRYGADVARLHMVDPEKLYFFWEATDETVKRSKGRQGRLTARLQRIDGTERTATQSPGVFAVGSWYFDAEPHARYRAEVGWLTPEGTFEPWLVSNTVETPRLAVSVTGEVVWRIARKSRTTRTAARGESLLGPEEHPSERPVGGASAAAARRRLAGREVSRQAWSGSVAAWSRTATPRVPGENR